MEKFERGSSVGSSPRVRGTLTKENQNHFNNRFIPACAGNTVPRSRHNTARSVHPRVCGEHFPPGLQPLPPLGSSPRVRGTRTTGPRTTLRQRFIPACAGNTRYYRQSAQSAAVHPRVCGEHLVLGVIKFVGGGSSPRVRGTPGRDCRCWSRSRFIPACAGNTVVKHRDTAPATVHPRVCGEHTKPSTIARPTSGSSPRVRGTPWMRLCWRVYLRFIPACAGNTVAQNNICSMLTVHPRVCGEHSRNFSMYWSNNGSSPRVRGTLWLQQAHSAALRFIPACAGNTPWHS